MKKIVWAVVVMAVLALPALGMAKKAKFNVVKPETKDYELITFKLGDSYGEGKGWLSYTVDPQTCLCFMNRMVGVDCKKLAVYPELKPYVEKCESAQ
jgi:hypothetical protein